MRAKYPGDCPRCPRPIRVGDDVVPAPGRRGEWIHRTCASGQDDDADE